ncbi:MAG: FecR domain-containing protein [Planctomycetota bacterium]
MAQVDVGPQLGEGADQLEVRIVAAMGLAQYRESEEGAWKKAEPGVTLPLGAELRTGLRSRVAFMVGDEHTITLDRLGVIKVLDAIQQDGKVQTEMGMRYGRASYQVQVGGVEHESKIRTPSATLAVRGSKGFVQEYAGRTPMAGSDFGNVAFVNTQGYEVPLAPETSVEGSQTSAAQQSLVTGTFLPQSGAVTTTETAVIESQPLFGTPSVGGAIKTFSEQEEAMEVINEITKVINENVTEYTRGFIDIIAYFRSDPLRQPVDVDILLRPPTGTVVDAANGNPAFSHSGDVVHTGATDLFFNEVIISNGELPFPVGTYLLSVQNQSMDVTAEVELIVNVSTDPIRDDAPTIFYIGNGDVGETFTIPPHQSLENLPIPVPLTTVPIALP